MLAFSYSHILQHHEDHASYHRCFHNRRVFYSSFSFSAILGYSFFLCWHGVVVFVFVCLCVRWFICIGVCVCCVYVSVFLLDICVYVYMFVFMRVMHVCVYVCVHECVCQGMPAILCKQCNAKCVPWSRQYILQNKCVYVHSAQGSVCMTHDTCVCLSDVCKCTWMCPCGAGLHN